MSKRFISIIKSSNNSENIGDDIIFELGKKYIQQKFNKDYLFYTSQKMPSDLISLKYQKQSDIQLLYGTNAITTKYRPSFMRIFGVKFGFWKSRKIKGKVVLMGVGSDGGKRFSFLQKKLYKKLLSKTELHSVRDEHSKIILNKIGFNNVINTSCPTTWALKPFVSKTPNSKSKIILSFSLFNDDPEFVKKLCKEALLKYDKTYVWIQTYGEISKFNEIVGNLNGLEIINPNIFSLKEIASQNNVFYIGTRLHAGIFNLNHQNPSVIIQIDQRAKGINEASGIPIVKYNKKLSIIDIEKYFSDSTKIKLANKYVKEFIND